MSLFSVLPYFRGIWNIPYIGLFPRMLVPLIFGNYECRNRHRDILLPAENKSNLLVFEDTTILMGIGFSGLTINGEFDSQLIQSIFLRLL